MRTLSRRFGRLLLFCAGLFLAGALSLRADNTISIIADSSLRSVLPQLVQDWADSQNDMKVDLQFTNAGILQSQLVEGKAGDVVIFASSVDAREAAKRGFIVGSEQKTFARNELVVYGRKAILKDEELDWYDLLAREWDQFALGDPAKTTSGRPAISEIEKHGLSARMKGEGVHLGGNEAVTLDFAKRGEADAVFLYRTDLAKATVEGFTVFPIDAGDYPALSYVAAPAKTTKALETARSFIQSLGGKEAQETLRKAGYGVDEKTR